MTIKATINSGLSGGDRSASLDAVAARLYERPAPVMAVVELLPVDRDRRRLIREALAKAVAARDAGVQLDLAGADA